MSPRPLRRHKFARTHTQRAAVNLSALSYDTGSPTSTTQYSKQPHKTCLLPTYTSCQAICQSDEALITSADTGVTRPVQAQNPTMQNDICLSATPNTDYHSFTPDRTSTDTPSADDSHIATNNLTDELMADSPQQAYKQLSDLLEFRDNDTLARLQRESPDLRDMIQYIETGVIPVDSKNTAAIVYDADNWCLLNNVLYHLYDPAKRNVKSVKPILKQLAVPQSPHVLHVFHDKLGHWRLDKTYSTIVQQYYWKGMYADVQQYISKCQPCSLASQRPPKPSFLRHPPLLGVFQHLVVDHICMPQTKDPLTGQTVAYILTMIDQASQWVELAPVADCTAKTTALALKTYWISRFGAPKILYTDLGTAYTAQVFQELCKLYTIQHVTAASQNHKAISRAETTHRLLLSALRKLCTEQTAWCEHLPDVLLGLRSSVVTTIGLSPAYMIFHRELRVPATISTYTTQDPDDKTLTQLAETASATDKLLHENTLASFASADKYHNRRATPRNFVVGQTVYLHNEHIPSGVMKKLHCFYRPVEIVEILPQSCYRLRDKHSLKTLPFKVHASRLKEAVNQEPIITAPQAATQADTPKPDTRSPPQPKPTPSDSAWHSITGILRRRRLPTGQYEYLVQWETDKSTSWLRAKDIASHVVRQYNADHRRRRRQ